MIRVIAIAVIMHQGKLLVAQGYDRLRDSHFYRPLGGGIEFGETAEQTICRELHEEIGATLTRVRALGVLENIYDWDGKAWHEIVFVLAADMTTKALYQQALIPFQENNGKHYTAQWRALTSFDAQHRLVPEGLAELLAEHHIA